MTDAEQRLLEMLSSMNFNRLTTEEKSTLHTLMLKWHMWQDQQYIDANAHLWDDTSNEPI